MFGKVTVKTRPLKLAYLVDPNSGRQVREAFRLSSTLWGGAYFPIITLYKLRMPNTWRDKPLKTPSPKDVILGYLEAFDPDILVQLSRAVPSFITDTGLKIIKPEEIWSRFQEDKSLSPQFGIGIFELLSDVFAEHFRYKAKYPIRVIIPQIPRKLSLFWVSLFGEILPTLTPVLEESYFEPLDIQMVNMATEELGTLLARDALFPRRLTQRGLKHFLRSGSRRNAHVYFLDAAKLTDVVDFWNLRALGRDVLPVPKQLKDDPQLKETVVDFLKVHRRPWKHDPKVCDFASLVRARSCTMEEVTDYAHSLKIDRDPRDPSGDPFFALQHWYPQIWEEWVRNKGEVAADTYGNEEDSIEVTDSTIRVPALLPTFAYTDYAAEPRCANEVSFRYYGSAEYLAEVFPKSSGSNYVRAISGLTSFRDWRVGRNGLVKLVTDDFQETRTVPAADQLFFAWLADLGWKPELSPPGLLAKKVLGKLGGNPNVLMNETLLKLLEHMNGGLVTQDGDTLKEDKLTRERDLPVGEVMRKLAGSSEVRDLHGYLASLGVFKLGIRVKCPHCLRHSWYSLERLADTLACPRCLATFPAIGNVSTTDWRYKTVGPFTVPQYADGAYGVLLTLGFFDDHRLHTIRTTPVLSFSAENADQKKLEADFALFWQESSYGENTEGILFGECKVYGEIKQKDCDRMRFLAKTFPGAVLVFSTLRTSLRAREITRITRLAKAGRKYWKPERPINPVLILTGTELLHRSGPPYCWEESLQKKFGRVHGLLDVCNATQQIYLGLRSWHEEWREKWDKEHQRRLAKERNIILPP
jgi:hypothetical protein